jgi:hypothetical protein
LVLALATLVVGLQWETAAAASKERGGANGPRYVHRPPLAPGYAPKAGHSLTWDDGAAARGKAGETGQRGTYVLLQHDQLGPTSTGVGPTAATAAQGLMRFGGSPQTTGLAGPFIQAIGMSWSIFTCTTLPCPYRIPATGVMYAVNAHFWDATGVAPVAPNNLIFSTAAPTTINQFVSFTFSGPLFAPTDSWFAGVGAAGPVQPNLFWLLAGEGILTDAHREWFGEGSTTAFSIGPTTFSTQFIPVDLGIRVLVDPGVPVELERFEATAG